MKFFPAIVITMFFSNAFATENLPQCTNQFKEAFNVFSVDVNESYPVILQSAYNYAATKSPSLKESARRLIAILVEECNGIVRAGPNQRCLLNKLEYWDKEATQAACNKLERSYYENFY